MATPHALYTRVEPEASFFETAANIVTPVRVSTRTVFDTTENPNEACLYGDDMKLVVTTIGNRRLLTLAGPEGEVQLDAAAWRAVVAAMKLGVR